MAKNILIKMGYTVNIVMVIVDGNRIEKEYYDQIKLNENSNGEIFNLIGGG